MLVRNKDHRPKDYSEIKKTFRPSHADATYQKKYGIQASSGGGRASARETIGRVAAGSVAKQLLTKSSDTEILAWVKRIHDIEAEIQPNEVTFDEIEKNVDAVEENILSSEDDSQNIDDDEIINSSEDEEPEPQAKDRIGSGTEVPDPPAPYGSSDLDGLPEEMARGASRKTM